MFMLVYLSYGNYLYDTLSFWFFGLSLLGNLNFSPVELSTIHSFYCGICRFFIIEFDESVAF